MKVYTEDEVKKYLRLRGIDVSLIHNLNQLNLIMKEAMRDTYSSAIPNEALWDIKAVLQSLNTIIDKLQTLLPYEQLGFTESPDV